MPLYRGVGSLGGYRMADMLTRHAARQAQLRSAAASEANAIRFQGRQQFHRTLGDLARLPMEHQRMKAEEEQRQLDMESQRQRNAFMQTQRRGQQQQQAAHAQNERNRARFAHMYQQRGGDLAGLREDLEIANDLPMLAILDAEEQRQMESYDQRRDMGEDEVRRFSEHVRKMAGTNPDAINQDWWDQRRSRMRYGRDLVDERMPKPDQLETFGLDTSARYDVAEKGRRERTELMADESKGRDAAWSAMSKLILGADSMEDIQGDLELMRHRRKDLASEFDAIEQFIGERGLDETRATLERMFPPDRAKLDTMDKVRAHAVMLEVNGQQAEADKVLGAIERLEEAGNPEKGGNPLMGAERSFMEVARDLEEIGADPNLEFTESTFVGTRAKMDVGAAFLAEGEAVQPAQEMSEIIAEEGGLPENATLAWNEAEKRYTLMTLDQRRALADPATGQLPPELPQASRFMHSLEQMWTVQMLAEQEAQRLAGGAQ